MKLAYCVKKPVRFDMLPLMDCMFLLLVFFIYTMLTMITHKGIPVNLPPSLSSVLNTKDYISISITQTGDLYYNKDLITLSKLSSQLKDLQSQNPPIYVSADQHVEYGKVAVILNLLQNHHFTHLSLEMGDSPRQKHE